MINPKLISAIVGAIAFTFIGPGQLIARSQNPLGLPVHLNFTPEQRAKLQQVKVSLDTQMRGILTPAQWNHVQGLLTQGNSQAVALSSLQLTPQQRARLQKAEAIVNAHLDDILSKDQKKQLATWREAGQSAAALTNNPAIPAAPIPTDNLQTAQASPTHQEPQPNPLSALNLSPAQAAQVKKIDALIQAQVQSVLTPTQWAELQALQASGASKEAALTKLNLSPDQIAQLREIEAIAQQRLLSILNTEQKKQLQEGQLSPSSPAPPASPSPTPPAQSPAPPTGLAALNLTTDQQAQVQQIQALAEAQIQSILRPEQWKQLQTLQSAKLPQAAALKQINLTGDQKSQLQDVEALTQQRILSILTAEQKKQLLNP